MRVMSRLGMVVALGVAASGCIVEGTGHDHGGGGGGTTGPVADAARPLGLQQVMGYPVAANASAVLPDGDLGYVVTANGAGGYRVVWSDTYGSPAVFSGQATTDGSFDPAQLQGFSGAEDITLSADGGTITFSSVPGANLDGVDLVSSTDPIYLDLRVDGARDGFGIYFTGGESGAQRSSDFNPVAFTSP